MARGGGRLFEGGDYFKYFGQRGAINRGTAITRQNTVLSFDSEYYFFKLSWSIKTKVIK